MAEYHEIVYSSVGNQSEGLANAAETDLTLRPPAHIPLADITNADTKAMLTHYKRSRDYSRALEVKRLRVDDVVATEDIDNSVVHSAAAFVGVAWQSLSQAIPAIQQNDLLNVIIARLDRAEDQRASDQQLAAAQRASDQQLADDQRASDQQLAADQTASIKRLADVIKNGTAPAEADAIGMSGVPGFPAMERFR
jgi:hypothetical protein